MMLRLRFSTLLVFASILMVSLSGCGKGDYSSGKEKASTPTMTFKAFAAAMNNKDIVALKRIFSREMLKEIKQLGEKTNKSEDEVIKMFSGLAPYIVSAEPVTRNEKIEGDNANLEVQAGDGKSWLTYTFVKEDGEWKMPPRRL